MKKVASNHDRGLREGKSRTLKPSSAEPDLMNFDEIQDPSCNDSYVRLSMKFRP